MAKLYQFLKVALTAFNWLCYDALMTLPILVADDDFIEHLYEMSHLGTIELDELYFEWDEWAADNLE